LVKYTSEPTITIDTLELPPLINGSKIIYKGLYETNDLNEPLSSYEFCVFDDKGDLYLTSGTQTHNSDSNKIIASDISLLQSEDEFITTLELEEYRKYSIVYKVKTINGLELQSQFYTIIK
jgi:hypothetical protein